MPFALSVQSPVYGRCLTVCVFLSQIGGVAHIALSFGAHFSDGFDY